MSLERDQVLRPTGQELMIFARWGPDARAFIGIGIGDCCGNAELAFL
jgi:hypothetical protein